MKRITKLASVVALTVVLAASLMACGGKDPVAEDDSKTASDKSTAAPNSIISNGNLLFSRSFP